MITELPDLDDKDRTILSLLEENPEMSQRNIAEKLCITQPSVSARIYKLQQRGMLTHIVGIDLKKAGLCTAIVNITTSDTSSVIDSFKNCPYFLNGFIITGQANMCLFFIAEDISTLEAIVNEHLRNDPSVDHVDFNIVVSPIKNFIVPLKMNFDSNIPPCGNKTDCYQCNYHKSQRCDGCPITSNYTGKIWNKNMNIKHKRRQELAWK